MKKILALLLALFLCFQLTACADLDEDYDETDDTDTVDVVDKSDNVNSGDTWAIYWYLCGSNLESEDGCATTDIIEALHVHYPDNVTLVIETGGSSAWQNDVISAETLQRWVVENDDLVLVDEVPSASMGEASTLADFLSFASTNYPADKVAVVFWNHGGGSTSGAAYDELYDNDYLSLVEMYEAFSSVYELSTDNPPFELIGFDTCLMATIDSAYCFSDIAHYLVASEETEPGNGWYYSGWLGALAENPEMNGAELGKEICDAFYYGCEMEGTSEDVTLSVTDLSKISALLDAYEAFGQEVLYTSSQDPEFIATFARAALKSENYGGNTKEQGYSDMVDIGHLARLTSDVLPSSASVLSTLNDCIVYHIAGPYRSESTGLSCYYSYDSDIDNLNGYLENGAGSAFKYFYAYGVTGEILDGGEEYLSSLGITEMPELLNIGMTDWDGIKLEYSDIGGAQMVLGEDASSILSEIKIELYYCDVDSDTMMLLGYDNDLYADWDAGIFTDNFRGVWPSLNGIPLYVELTFEGDDYNLYSSPILLNDELYYLEYAYDFTNEEWIILGATQGMDESGMASKETRILKEGDEITVVWMMSSLSGDDELEMYASYSITVDSSLTLSESDLDDGCYLLDFIMSDVFGGEAISDSARFDIEYGEIYTTVFD